MNEKVSKTLLRNINKYEDSKTWMNKRTPKHEWIWGLKDINEY